MRMGILSRRLLVALAIGLVSAVMLGVMPLPERACRIPPPQHAGGLVNWHVEWWCPRLRIEIDRDGCRSGNHPLRVEDLPASLKAFGARQPRDASGDPCASVCLYPQADTPWGLVRAVAEACAAQRVNSIILCLPQPTTIDWAAVWERIRYCTGGYYAFRRVFPDSTRQLALNIYEGPRPGAITKAPRAGDSAGAVLDDPLITVSLHLVDAAGRRIQRPVWGARVALAVDGQDCRTLDDAVALLESLRCGRMGLVAAAPGIPYEWVFETCGLVQLSLHETVFLASSKPDFGPLSE